VEDFRQSARIICIVSSHQNFNICEFEITYLLHSTVVRVYAVESDLPDLEENQDITKIFIDEDDLLKILRKNLQGKYCIAYISSFLRIHSGVYVGTGTAYVLMFCANDV
jgi:hypothetical protein